MHTPGPWTATRDIDVRGTATWRIDAPTQSLIAALRYPNVDERDAGEPDARLIAAAPDMLAALQAVLAETESYGPDAVPLVRAAIAKATQP